MVVCGDFNRRLSPIQKLASLCNLQLREPPCPWNQWWTRAAKINGKWTKSTLDHFLTNCPSELQASDFLDGTSDHCIVTG